MVFLLAASLAAWYPASADVMARAHSATARLTAADGGCGTGTAFEVSQGRVFLVTCAHVASRRQLEVEWFYAGHKSGPVAGALLWRDEASDVAVVMVPQAALAGVLPPTLPLAPPDYAVNKGEPLYSVGSAHGAWVTGFEGHATGYTELGLQFTPPPANGRSGSAIVNGSGQIVGVVRARAEASGYATPVTALYRLWGAPHQRTAARATETLCAQQWQPFGGAFRNLCPGGGCPGGTCPVQPEQQAPAPQSGGIWPTLPRLRQDVQSVEPPAPLDLQPIVDAIRGPPEEAELRKRALTAEAEYYESMKAKAEEEKHQKIISSIPDDAGAAVGQAVTGNFSGALDTATSDPMLGWLGQILVWVLTGVVGLTGIPALAVRFLVPMATKLIGRRLKAAFTTEADDVADEVAERVAKKVTEKVTEKSGRK